MNLPLSGSDCLLRISDGQPSPTHLLVEGVRLSSWKLNQEEVEVTDFADGAWRRLLSGAGLRSLEVRLSGLYLGSAGELRLRYMAFGGMAEACEMSLDGSVAVRGKFIASELSFESVVNEEATYAAILRSAGPITII